ncbi:MAG: protein kinase [Verrucomicrobiaceae bacterium]|nr:protein kinase [Verrucomicrobiaceae bacterium]
MSILPPISLLSPFGWSHRFDDLQKIGSGAMGQVWRAREVATGRTVALKLLDPARSGDEQTLARLEIEGETLTRLREAGAHEHVVPILDFQITDEQACIVMEFIPGLNLKRWCETHRLPLRDRVKLIAQVARAAGWFHGHGIVHRDLKPANILVSSLTRQPVIVDFSIAKQQEGLTLTLTNEALGTAPYMAPEQIDRARGPVSPATDVYGIGATLYELLTQVHPHPGDLTQVVRRHAEEIRPAPPSALNPDIPRDLECVLLKALSHRPADRYLDGIALADDLDRFLTGEPVHARPLPLATRFVRRARRKPALTAALAACVVLGAFALWNVQRSGAQRERFALQTRLTTAMQNTVWNQPSLEEAETILAALETSSAPLAAQIRQRFHDDVVRDMESRLQQNHLREEDYTWLRTLNTWLQPRAPLHASRLQSLITEREGRWETRAQLRAPFSDLQGLFPRSEVQVTGSLLYPAYDGPPEVPSPITFTDSVSVPSEVIFTFQVDAHDYHPATIVFYHQGARVAAGLYRVRHLSTTMRGQMLKDTSADLESFVLTLKVNQDDIRTLHIPDVHLLDQPFRMSVRLERDWVEARVNERHSLRADFVFTQASAQATNYWRLNWPKNLGLKELTLRTRRADAISPLEEADLAAMQGSYAEAIRHYERLRGDPQFGAEARYKTAECLLLQGESAEALPLWKSLATGPSSQWRDRSLIRLWIHSVISESGDAHRYLALLPDPLPASMIGHVSQKQVDVISQAYAHVGMSSALPRVDPIRITEATKAFRLLRQPPVQIASRFALAHHSAGLDRESYSLYWDGLDDALQTVRTPDDMRAVTNCLDQSCRIQPSESNVSLASRLNQWKKKRPDDPTVQALWHMEQARRAARGRNLRGAITLIQEARQLRPEEMDNRIHTSLWLLEGMLYRLQNTEDRAQSAWQKARSIAQTVTMRSPLHLMDRVILGSLAQAWDLRMAGDLLTTLAGRHLIGEEQTKAKAAFNGTFLTDPAWLTTFNAVLQSDEGRQFAEDYVLCRQPPRELVRCFYRLLFEHYFLTTAFPQATPEQTARVHQIVGSLVTEMAMNPRGEISHLYAYLRAWNDPAAAKTLFDAIYPYSPVLIKDMQWLLQQRHPR